MIRDIIEETIDTLKDGDIKESIKILETYNKDNIYMRKGAILDEVLENNEIESQNFSQVYSIIEETMERCFECTSR